MPGWDDEDDDWVRRDHGPRPHVPDHGRRPLLMALPIFLITLAAIVAVLIAGCGDDEPAAAPQGTSSSSAPAPTQALSPAAVATKVVEGAALFSGLADPDSFADTTCKATEPAGDFLCERSWTDPAVDHERVASITVRADANGSVSKLLGGKTAGSGQPEVARVAELLAADDTAAGEEELTYACAASTAINPDGSSAGSTVPGFRCAALRGKKPVAQRYVQFGADGTAVRDFEVQAP